MILMQIRSPVTNHAGIYLGDGQMLHHLHGRLSETVPYGGMWAERTRCIVRHREVAMTVFDDPPVRQAGGALGRRFRLAVNSPAEAVHALCTMLPGFQQYLMGAKAKGMEFAVFNGRQNLSRDQLHDPPGQDDIRIAPVLVGSKRGRTADDRGRRADRCGGATRLGLVRLHWYQPASAW
jgi:hypothetical protein